MKSTTTRNVRTRDQAFPVDLLARARCKTAQVALCLAIPALAVAQSATPGLGSAVVHTAFGGFILGYDIDRFGTEGVLCEAFTLANGNHDIAVETFDQATGAIIRVVRRQLNSNNAFVALGIAEGGVGLVEFEHATSLFVDDRRYLMLNPLSANTFTRHWTPPLGSNDIILSMSASQEAPASAFLGFHNGGTSDTFVFGSTVGTNRFGPLIVVNDPNFTYSNSPVMALDSATNHAVIAASNGCPLCHPKLAQVNLTNGATGVFNGVGYGYVNGIAIDPVTRVACTSTEVDFRVEFYNLDTHTGFVVPIPGATSQAQSGQDVQLDPIHGLFLVGQTYSSVAASGSSILVFNEQGQFIASVDGLALPASPARLALNPSLRTGYVLVAPDLTTLQSFT